MKRASLFFFMAGLVTVIGAFGAGCKQEVSAPGQAAAVSAPASSAQAAASPQVAKIVFIGKKNACDCTRKRVDDSLGVLQKTLEGQPAIPVEQLQVDVDAEAVARYQELRPIMVLPAIYLLGDSGALVDVLQGEVTPEQVKKALGG